MLDPKIAALKYSSQRAMRLLLIIKINLKPGHIPFFHFVKGTNMRSKI